MDAIVRHTAAHIPKNVVYDTEQKQIFYDTDVAEQWFSKHYDNLILDDYVIVFQNFLERIHQTIVHIIDSEVSLERRREIELSCPLARIVIRMNTENSVMLQSIQVRPCAAKIGIGKIILWQLIKTCQSINMNLIIYRPVAVARALLKSLNCNFIYYPESRASILHLMHMHQASLASFRLGNKIAHSVPEYKVLLNKSEFPHVDALNYGSMH